MEFTGGLALGTLWNSVRRTVTLWRLLYLSVTVATFRHSAHGFATLEHGNVWLGALSALAVDAGMILAAESLHKLRSRWLYAGLGIAALTSIYTQLLYAVANADSIVIADGALWLGPVALWIANMRVVLLPMLLPVIVVVYSFASDARNEQESMTEEQEMAAERATTKIAQAMQLLELYPEVEHTKVADLVGCHVATVTRAEQRLNGKGK